MILQNSCNQSLHLYYTFSATPQPRLTNVESDSVELHLAKARVMSKILL